MTPQPTRNPTRVDPVVHVRPQPNPQSITPARRKVPINPFKVDGPMLGSQYSTLPSGRNIQSHSDKSPAIIQPMNESIFTFGEKPNFNDIPKQGINNNRRVPGGREIGYTGPPNARNRTTTVKRLEPGPPQYPPKGVYNHPSEVYNNPSIDSLIDFRPTHEVAHSDPKMTQIGSLTSACFRSPNSFCAAGSKGVILVEEGKLIGIFGIRLPKAVDMARTEYAQIVFAKGRYYIMFANRDIFVKLPNRSPLSLFKKTSEEWEKFKIGNRGNLISGVNQRTLTIHGCKLDAKGNNAGDFSIPSIVTPEFKSTATKILDFEVNKEIWVLYNNSCLTMISGDPLAANPTKRTLSVKSCIQLTEELYSQGSLMTIRGSNQTVFVWMRPDGKNNQRKKLNHYGIVRAANNRLKEGEMACAIAQSEEKEQDSLSFVESKKFSFLKYDFENHQLFLLELTRRSMKGNSREFFAETRLLHLDLTRIRTERLVMKAVKSGGFFDDRRRGGGPGRATVSNEGKFRGLGLKSFENPSGSRVLSVFCDGSGLKSTLLHEFEDNE